MCVVHVQAKSWIKKLAKCQNFLSLPFIIKIYLIAQKQSRKLKVVVSLESSQKSLQNEMALKNIC